MSPASGSRSAPAASTPKPMPPRPIQVRTVPSPQRKSGLRLNLVPYGGSTILTPTPAPAGTHWSGGTPELWGGGQGGHRPPRQLAKVALAPAPRATTHLSRRSRPERPPVARSRPGGLHPQLRRFHGLKLSALKSLHQCLLQCRTMMTQRAPGSDGSSLESAGSGPFVSLRAGCVACVHTGECLCG